MFCKTLESEFVLYVERELETSKLDSVIRNAGGIFTGRHKLQKRRSDFLKLNITAITGVRTIDGFDKK